jgi:L-histidine N-alpha-methyltransferase
LLIGLDLKKSPNIIIDAYDDPHGHTRDFNLNLLTRLNRELDANFDTDQFVQHTTYNPQTGDIKSFLISKIEQEVSIKSIEKSFHFRQWEPIFMERSKKYDMQTIKKLASANGFKVEQNFTDSNDYFVDSLWVRM